MALFVIVVLYTTIGVMAAAGSVAITNRIFSAKAEQTFFGPSSFPSLPSI